jgi:putative ABC transport system substrate-binding protein
MPYGMPLDLNQRVADYVDKILNGERPAEQSVKTELVISLNIAKALGLTIPPSLLAGG